MTEVSGENQIVTAADLERMTPQQRLAVIDSSRAQNWDEVPEPFRSEVETAALRLGEQRRERA